MLKNKKEKLFSHQGTLCFVRTAFLQTRANKFKNVYFSLVLKTKNGVQINTLIQICFYMLSDMIELSNGLYTGKNFHICI